ncbi:MAG: hypothetical protein V8Q78_10045 [Blautia sp.]
MKKMYFLKDRKEAVIDRLTYMSKHRQEYLQDKEHGMITLQFQARHAGDSFLIRQGNVILGFFF